MSRTGQQVYQAFCEVLNDWWSSTTTSNGASDGTSIIDTKLSAFGDNRLAGRYARMTELSYVVRKASRSTQSSGTLTFPEAFSAQVASGNDYELHRYDPVLAFKAIDQVRLEEDVMESAFKIVLDDTTTADGRSTVFDVPSTIEQGPHLAFVEVPLAADVDWNFLTTPNGDATTGWTATSLTLSTRAKASNDLLVPKFGDPCQSFAVATTTNGTLVQAVAAQTNDITAALAAGRKMTFAMDVYCLTASRVTLKITDDAGTTTGTAHAGRGWERIYVERTISSTNATTLTVTLDVSNASGAVAGFAERRWFYFGDKERVTDAAFDMTQPIRVRLDDTQKHFIMSEAPSRGYQIRLQGKAPLSALGTSLTTQVTNTMEVDEKTEKVVACAAAELMLEWGAIVADDVERVEQRIAAVRGRLPRIKKEWRVQPEKYRMTSVYDG